MRNARRVGLLLAAVTIAASVHLVANHAGAGDRAGSPVTPNAVTHRDDAAVAPLARLTRAGRPFGNPVDAALAFAWVTAAVAAGWLLLAARRRDRVTGPLVAFPVAVLHSSRSSPDEGRARARPPPEEKS